MKPYFYIDTSAAIKLITEEKHSAAFTVFYDTNTASSWVSSALLRIELIRAVSRVRPALLPDARALLQAFDYVSIDGDIVEMAMAEPDCGLRSLDAIHLATARLLSEDLHALITYDQRLATASSDAGLTVITPEDK